MIAGAGVAALEALLALRHLAGDRIELELISPSSDFVYRPLTVLEPFGGEPPKSLPWGEVLREHGAGHVLDAVVAVAPESRRIHTKSGLRIDYDALLIAIGATPEAALPGALTFPGPGAVDAYRGLLDDIDRGDVRDVVFAVPVGSRWTLPLYEVALLTASHLFERRQGGVRLTLATHESAPLAAFGDQVADAVAELFERDSIAIRLGVEVAAVNDTRLELVGGDAVPADRVVALPRLVGPALRGLPSDPDGFLPVDDHCRVVGVENVYAAGDATDSPVKQGGLAAQQADAAAASLAAWAGAPVRPEPFHPVLRAMLLGGDEPAYLRSDTRGDRRRSLVGAGPLWWPPAKVAGGYLAPYLAARGIRVPEASGATHGG